MPHGGPRPNSGRKTGSRNRATLGREAKEREVEVLAAEAAPAALAVQAAERTPVYLRAKDELAALLPIVKGHLVQFQKAALAAPPGDPKYSATIWKTYKEWLELYDKVCNSAGDFQDPRLKATAHFMPPPPPAQPPGDTPKVVRLGNAVASSRAYQQLMRAPRQLALPAPAKRPAAG